MKKKLSGCLLAFVISIVSFGQLKKQTSDGAREVIINAAFTKAATLQAIMDRYAPKDLPGISMAVYTQDEGWWAGASGYSKTEGKIKMTTANLQYTQSVSKTYMAVAILKLHEEGRILLDVPITTYLPAKYAKYIINAKSITVRMLLNHTSGVGEYSTNPVYTAALILHPTKIFKMEDALRCLENEAPLFPPGTKFQYTNTNYTLLAMIADAITGDHARYLEEKIFKPLGLTHTFYRGSNNYLNYPSLTDSYWDILNTGQPANITALQRANVATMKGDDGIVCTPMDAIKFLKGIVEGKVLADSSVALMEQWVKNEKGEPKYGMGLFYFSTGELIGYGHGGGGVGAGCLLLFVPAKHAYIFIATNVGVLFEGLPAKFAEDFKNEILAALFL